MTIHDTHSINKNSNNNNNNNLSLYDSLNRLILLVYTSQIIIQ